MKGLLASIGLAGSLLLVCAAAATATPSGGTIRLFVAPGQGQGEGTAIVAGAIGDYGKTTKINKTGVGEMLLHKGTIRFNLAAIVKKLSNAKPIIANTKTCSFVFGATAPVAISNGTGLYKGISGTIILTETFAGYGPYYTSGPHKGKCNTSDNATPTAEYGSVQGEGTVKFN